MAETFRVESTSSEVSGSKVVVLDIVGSVDSSVAKELEAAFMAALNDGSTWLVLGLSKMDYISSAGLRLLLKFRKQAIEAGGALKIAALQRDIRENVFDALGFSRLIDIYETAEEALASIGQQKR